MRFAKAGHEISDKTGVFKISGWRAKQNTRGPNYPNKRTNSAGLAYFFGKVSKDIENCPSEKVYVRYEREEPDKAVLHRSSFSGLGGSSGPISP